MDWRIEALASVLLLAAGLGLVCARRQRQMAVRARERLQALCAMADAHALRERILQAFSQTEISVEDRVLVALRTLRHASGCRRVALVWDGACVGLRLASRERDRCRAAMIAGADVHAAALMAFDGCHLHEVRRDRTLVALLAVDEHECADVDSALPAFAWGLEGALAGARARTSARLNLLLVALARRLAECSDVQEALAPALEQVRTAVGAERVTLTSPGREPVRAGGEDAPVGACERVAAAGSELLAERAGHLRGFDAEERAFLESAAALLGATLGMAEARARAQQAAEARLAREHERRRFKSLATLSGGLSHELNNPLAAVQSNLEYLRADHTPDEEKEDVIVETLAALQRATGIVARLKSIAEPAAARARDASLDAVAAASLEALARALERKQICVRSTFAAPAPVREGERLSSVVVELMTNAVRAMGQGGTLEVTTYVDAAAAMSVLVVADDGPGMDGAAREQAFDPFFTSKNEWTSPGLGLPVCRALVDGFGGSMELGAQSSGVGTTVTVRIPLDGVGFQADGAGAPPRRRSRRY